MKENVVINLQMAKEEINKLIAYRESLINYYKNIKSSLESLEFLKEENILLPIGTDIFIESKVVNKDVILIGIGSNIYVEMKINNAKEFLEKKLKKVEEEIEEVNLYIQSLQNYIITLLNEIKRKE